MKSKFKKQLIAILVSLGLADKAKTDAGLTNDEWVSACNAYQEKYGVGLIEDMNATDDSAAATEEQEASISQEQLDSLQSTLSSLFPAAAQQQDAQQQTVQQPATVQGITELVSNVATLVRTIQGQAAQDVPEAVVLASGLQINGPGTNATHLFGIDNPLFALSARYNRIAVNPALAMSSPINDTDKRTFTSAVVGFTASLQQRYAYLHENGMLNAEKLAAGEFSHNYQGVTDAKVGDQYVILRQDALIARVLMKRDLTVYFPVRYGIQDHDLVFNAFFDSVSQAYQTGRVFKGGMKIESEMGHVDDAMIKLDFGPMKDLERKYIAYLNKEGSDPIKWTMIEFAILNSLETAQVEQNKRRMRGIYVKPETGVAGHYLSTSTGVLYTLIRYYHELKLKLHEDDSYQSYTSANMVDAVQEFLSDVMASCTEDMDIDNHVIYLNAMHKSWWLKGIRAKYGKDIDFAGPNSYANVVPDTSTRIVWLPYLGQLPLIFMDVPGNIQFLEYIPGEMMAMKVSEDMEEVKAWSTWKEGTAAAFTGRRFSKKADLDANNYEWQQIFMNKPSVSLLADATTVDATKGFWYVSVANAKATAITDITSAKEGVAYIIECGSTTNATTIAKSGSFDSITAAWTPTQVGDYIMIYKLSTGKFAELERCVGGSRTVNAAVQPNVPGVR